MRCPLAIIACLLALLLGRETAAWHLGPARASDGDTLKIGEAGFRLKGVRAPEHGKKAKVFVDGIIKGRWIACRETGRLTFSRYEAFCYTMSGQDVGAALIRAGLACAASNPRWRVEGYRDMESAHHPRDCGYGA